MNKKVSKNKYGKVYEYYICSTYRKKSTELCTIHKIRAPELEEAVLQSIKLHIDLFVETDKLLKQIDNTKMQNTQNKLIENMINLKKKEIDKISKIKLELYEDWKNEDITREEYLQYKQKYELDLDRIKENIENLEVELQDQDEIKEIQNEWMKSFKENKNITKLSREIVVEMIDYIYIYENGEITIKFKFEDEFKKILDYINDSKIIKLD